MCIRDSADVQPVVAIVVIVRVRLSEFSQVSNLKQPGAQNRIVKEKDALDVSRDPENVIDLAPVAWLAHEYDLLSVVSVVSIMLEAVVELRRHLCLLELLEVLNGVEVRHGPDPAVTARSELAVRRLLVLLSLFLHVTVHGVCVLRVLLKLLWAHLELLGLVLTLHVTKVAALEVFQIPAVPAVQRLSGVVLL